MELEIDLNEERHGYVCDCGGATFQITTPCDITCDSCGFTLPDMVWILLEDETR